MSYPDWIVLIAALLVIILYGVYKSRSSKSLDGYFLSDREMPWWLILLSIVGTQASAITFLSAPGQAYTDGMRFVQYYFGLPLAMVVLCVTLVPMFHRLKLYTAYEYLEQRFDLKTRTYTTFLFLLQRGVSTGVSVYAPSIILSSLLGWNIYVTNIFMGGLLIIYTVTGGARAVAYTQQLQLVIVFVSIFITAYMVVNMLPGDVGFFDALRVGGKMGKLNVITTGMNQKGSGFDWSDQYNIFSGLIGGFFLALSYFGTDQSQVGRYLTAKSTRESKIGLLLNGLVKVPMQFLILLIGVLVFSFYQFHKAPLFFNNEMFEKVSKTSYSDSVKAIQVSYDKINDRRVELMATFHPKNDDIGPAAQEELKNLNAQGDSLRKSFMRIAKKSGVAGETKDTNYIFLRFVIDYMPKGLVGLMIAVIFLASWGSIAAALNSLASASVVDFHKKFINADLTHEQDVKISRWYTFFWGVFSIIVAQYVNNVGNSLIEAVNKLGSLFYGVTLGVFIVGYFLKWVKGSAVFWSAVVSELLVVLIFIMSENKIIGLGFLWLNFFGALSVAIIAILLQASIFKNSRTKST
ncbi:MAG: sodium:solute symporter [Bacteroidetes bacterium]|nr:MAG: sodium:solute symporter [Bacteroidota bacterium]